ncbi:DUF5017 domain-containing protein [Mucilaginibacter paludis]|uniref:DUF5017 domain-containing protein n=1 Tax=Mucilaginibacter paludis DSM 18603 TaxID=714943 RepID=H1Y5H8_9SPHI|nr:DUF5017 domain-containing protein [Mucilaginibacter paludis]EHQ29330.1 hypothetical protein Mucpa_5255 [Mucilaginibacter paludis DSM 18603]
MSQNKNIIPVRSLILIAFLFACSACSKKIDVKPVTFDVSSNKLKGAASTTFTLTDTVLFKFTGNPDMITFFSGEVGKRYEYAGRTSAAGMPQLQFSTVRANGAQAGSLSLLVSTDFKGVVANTVYGSLIRDTAATNANIAAATWTDITSRATLSTGATTAVSSGLIDLSDFSKGKPVYIAFKYTATAGTIQNKWTISALSVNNVLADGTTYTIASLNGPTTAITNYGSNTYGPGWAVSYDLAKNANKYAWVYTDKTSLVITGATTAAAATAGAEVWAVMGPVDLTRVTPDVGLSIKAISARLSSYQYNYAAAGTYNAVFVASNTTPDASNSIVKKNTITVTP